MVTRLDKFKREMEPAKELYTKEIEDFAKNYDFLGKMRLEEMPDIDTQDYIFCFEKLNGTSEDVLDKTLTELYDHMDEFSKANGINRFSRNVVISYEWWFDGYEKIPAISTISSNIADANAERTVNSRKLWWVVR